jgi:GNAT superfamily N-acetyltransferase
MKIRKLDSTDYETIHSLITNEMGHSEVQLANMSSWLDQMRNDKNQLLFVAEVDNQVVAFISAIKSIGCIDGFFIDITCLIVSKAFQGKGIGKALLQFVEDIGQSEDITRFSVTSGKQREEAHAFYVKNNYGLSGFAFYKGLVVLEEQTGGVSDNK